MFMKRCCNQRRCFIIFFLLILLSYKNEGKENFIDLVVILLIYDANIFSFLLVLQENQEKKLFDIILH